ncbi:MAG: T9SS type A sorting domain-containing protein [Flavobacteriales bacterium]|nr:T9SS type A sorting domain-containing protein [Flavobacteriales bacterium]
MNNRWRPKVARLVGCCLLFVATLNVDAQGNLVPNASFEENLNCPMQPGFTANSKPLNWEKWLNSPEYFHACAGTLGSGDSLISVPLNGMGFQYPLDGDAYVGIATYKEDFREYVGCELLEPLMVGQSYNLSFYANMATGGTYWNPRWASNNLGMLFTMEHNIWTGLSGPPFSFRNYAHLHSTAVITDTANWTLVSGTFVADSAYRYLVLGNFFEDAVTDTVHVAGPASSAAYYFIDGVCVTAGLEGCPFTTGFRQETATCLNIWPNPASDHIQVRGAESQFEVLDMLGRRVCQGWLKKEVAVLDVLGWPNGQYVLRTVGEKKLTMRFVVMH